jgi:hypothetical protein
MMTSPLLREKQIPCGNDRKKSKSFNADAAEFLAEVAEVPFMAFRIEAHFSSRTK